MIFEIAGIEHKDLEVILFDITMQHDLRAFKIRKNKEGNLLLTVNKKHWIKTWNDTGCPIKDTKEDLEGSFKEELEGMGHEGVKVLLIEKKNPGKRLKRYTFERPGLIGNRG